jgi:FtsP/CotA-like multicopper oxidase with cupredoxin domain
MTPCDRKRRQFLQKTALASLAVGLPGFALAAKDSNQVGGSAFKPDVEIELTAKTETVSLRPGPATRVFRYHAQLRKGSPSTLTKMPGYLGPTLNFVHGQKVRIIFHNQLPEPTITHWHGLHVPQNMDGHPMYAINQGQSYLYEFEVKNPAGTNWYHAHPHELTATQVYQGLAGLITITDEQEKKLELPGGEFDLPIVIQDRSFSADNQLQYLQHGMRERMVGFLGDTILVNGQINPVIPVKTRAYRVRFFNGSNARIYKLGWKDGTPLTVIGTDGALLEKPTTYPYIILAPAERVECWVDFSGRDPGTDLVLHSLEFHGAMPRMGGGMRGGMGGGGMGMMMDGLVQGEEFPVVKFHIAEKVSESPKLPNMLTKFRRLSEQDISNPSKVIPIALSMRRMSPQLNGLSFEMQDVVDIERIPVNSIQKIRIFHDDPGMRSGRGGGMGGMRGGRGGMGMMSMPHPIHLHGEQFQILSREMRDQNNSSYATVKDGFVNNGWKDTVLVMPGEEVTILKPFNEYTGLYLYHCHNLEHEDMGMMRNFLVS